MTIEEIKSIIREGVAARDYFEKKEDYFKESFNDIQNKKIALKKYYHLKEFFAKELFKDSNITLDEFEKTFVKATEDVSKNNLGTVTQKFNNLKNMECDLNSIITGVVYEAFDSRMTVNGIIKFLDNEVTKDEYREGNKVKIPVKISDDVYDSIKQKIENYEGLNADDLRNEFPNVSNALLTKDEKQKSYEFYTFFNELSAKKKFKENIQFKEEVENNKDDYDY